MKSYKAIIGGEDVDTGAWIEVVNPSTGEALARVAEGGAAEIEAALGAAAEALPAWAARQPSERAAVLARMAELVREQGDELALTESRDTGKPLSQAQADVRTAARYFEFYSRVCESLYGDTIPGPAGRFIYTVREPLGVTGHIIPWNYPLQIAARTIAPALAVGNCCVLKPAEDAPITPMVLGRIGREAGLPAGALNVVPGYGETAGAALASSPKIGHLSFTGSREVGVLVAQSAAANIVPVALELGGKSPNIVFADADIERATATVKTALLQNSGQTCSAGTRLIVERSIHEPMVKALKQMFESAVIGQGETDPDLGPLISGVQLERVRGFVERGGSAAELIVGGRQAQVADAPGGNYFEATIFDRVPSDSEIGREEVFGPVLTVSPFEDEDEAIEVANATDYGLVAGVWTADSSRAQRFARAIESGQVFVNGYGAGGGVELPFGGFKQSGIGREKGIEAMVHYTQTKTVALEF